MNTAQKYIGQKEITGKVHNNVIVGFWKAIKSLVVKDDETPWCAAFVAHCLYVNGIPHSGKANARSYMNWGIPLDKPRVGAIAVFWRGSPKGWQGHVGFVAGRDAAGNLMILGGNQGNEVNIRPFTQARLLGYRWPKDIPYETDPEPLPLIHSDGRVSTNEA